MGQKNLAYAATVYDPYRNCSATNRLSQECLYVTCGNYLCKIRHTCRGIARMGQVVQLPQGVGSKGQQNMQHMNILN